MDNLTTVKKMISIIEKIQSYIKDMDYDAFVLNDIVAEACAFNL